LAKQIGIDEKTVRSIFDAYVAKLEKEFRRETPAWLGIDEIKLGRFRAIFTNLQDKTLVDMLPDRYYTSIVKFLESLPKRERIEYVSTDLWRPYRLAVQKVLPNAKLVADKFHVVSKANAAVDAVRRSIAKADQKKQGKGLKKAHKLFDKRAADQGAVHRQAAKADFHPGEGQGEKATLRGHLHGAHDLLHDVRHL